jgi:hypothetical protein
VGKEKENLRPSLTRRAAVRRLQTGNHRYLALVAEWKREWDAAGPAGRTAIGLEIYRTMTEGHHARFLVFVPATGNWAVQSRSSSLAKIQRALHDCVLVRPAPVATATDPALLVSADGVRPTDVLGGKGGEHSLARRAGKSGDVTHNATQRNRHF